MACGAWLVMCTVIVPLTESQSATMPQVSMLATWMRGMYRCSLTRVLEPMRAASVAALSPDSQCQMWLFCLPSPRSGRRTGDDGSIALYGSTTTSSGS